MGRRARPGRRPGRAAYAGALRDHRLAEGQHVQGESVPVRVHHPVVLGGPQGALALGVQAALAHEQVEAVAALVPLAVAGLPPQALPAGRLFAREDVEHVLGAVFRVVRVHQEDLTSPLPLQVVLLGTVQGVGAAPEPAGAGGHVAAALRLQSKRARTPEAAAAFLASVLPAAGELKPRLYVWPGSTPPPAFDLLGSSVPGFFAAAADLAAEKGPRRRAGPQKEKDVDKKRRKRKEPPPPSRTDIWEDLHSRAPTPGKRVTKHKPDCRCIVCARKPQPAADPEAEKADPAAEAVEDV